MPRINPFFNNLSETPVISRSDAIKCLKDYLEENSISLYSLPNGVIDYFIETVLYAPRDISTREIALRVGIHRNSHREVAQPTPSTPRRVQTISSQIAVQGIQASDEAIYDNYNRAYQDFLSSFQLTNDSSPATMNNVESMTETTEDEELDAIISEWSSPTSSYAPKKKKKKRSEKDMMMEIVRGENFPRPNFKDWSSSRELEGIMNDWYGNVDYREQWIFSRREREGFNRRNIGFFSLDDVMARMSKRKKPHILDSQFSKFYDWKLGGTDWILRLELFQHEQYYFLLTRHIHVPTDTEIKFDVRYWNNNQFKPINAVWCQQTNTPEIFERVFGSNDESSPYYIPPYEEDDYDEEPFDSEELESGDW